jgi:hypothetical protein
MVSAREAAICNGQRGAVTKGSISTYVPMPWCV